MLWNPESAVELIKFKVLQACEEGEFLLCLNQRFLISSKIMHVITENNPTTKEDSWNPRIVLAVGFRKKLLSQAEVNQANPLLFITLVFTVSNLPQICCYRLEWMFFSLKVTDLLKRLFILYGDGKAKGRCVIGSGVSILTMRGENVQMENQEGGGSELHNG